MGVQAAQAQLRGERMKCKDCPAGKKFTRRSHGCVECIQYGMILLEDHECEREGWKEYEHTEQDDTVQGMRETDRLYQNDEGEEHPGEPGSGVLHAVGWA